MYMHILNNYLNFNYGRSYNSHVISKEKYTKSDGKSKGVKDEKSDISISLLERSIIPIYS